MPEGKGYGKKKKSSAFANMFKTPGQIARGSGKKKKKVSTSRRKTTTRKKRSDG